MPLQVRPFARLPALRCFHLTFRWFGHSARPKGKAYRSPGKLGHAIRKAAANRSWPPGVCRCMAEPVSRPKVLIVEDEFLIRMTLAESLANEGFEVAEAANSEEARAILG